MPSSVQTSLNFLKNRELFSNHYLQDLLPETEEWGEVPEELREAYR